MSQVISRALLLALIVSCGSVSGEERSTDKLDVLIRAEFSERPLREVLETIGKAAGLKVHIDEAALRSEGVEGDTPVNLNLTQPISARSVLNLVLGPKGLSYEIQDGAIRVVSESDRSTYRKSYDLSRVANSTDEASAVVQKVERIVREMESKVRAADRRKLTLKGLTLIADQPQRVHEEIFDTLDLLGEHFRKLQEEEQLAARRKEAQRWNAAAFRRAEDLSGTDVSAHLETPITEGRNQVYCASFQLAWAELVRVVGEPPKLAGDPPLAILLNAGRIERETLSPDCYLAESGPLSEKYLAELTERIQRKFPSASLPLPTVDVTPGYLIYAHLLKQLAFENDFERLKDGVEFRHEIHVTSVASFGVEKYESTLERTLGKQVTVLDYRDDRDFIVKLHPKGDQDEIVLAMIAPEKSLAKTVDVVQQRIKRGQEAEQRKNLEAGESLKIPLLSAKVRRDYSELTDRQFLHQGRLSAIISQATQLISFRLNEQGAILESSAELEELLGIEIGEPPPIRHLVFDRPFLVMLKETGATQPYLAIWIGNTALMEPMPADKDER